MRDFVGWEGATAQPNKKLQVLGFVPDTVGETLLNTLKALILRYQPEKIL